MSTAVAETALVPIGDLVPHPANPRRGNVEAIAESLRAHRQYRAIVAQRSTRHVLAGNHTLAALKLNGETQALVHWLDVDDDEAKRILVADNRLSDTSTNDDALLAQLLSDLPDLAGTGFDDAAFQELLASVAEPSAGLTKAADDVPEPPKVPVTQRGDLWLLGEHRLLCGDSTSKADIGRLVAGKPVDAIITDPPYGMNLDADYSKRPRGANTYEAITGDDRPFDPRPLFETFASVAEQFWWGADYYCQHLPRDGSWLVWDKHDAEGLNAPGAAFELCWSRQKHKRIVIKHLWSGFTAKENGQHRVHPAQKPVAVIANIMSEWTKLNDVILDPFGGSGTTLIAAHQEGRVARLCEIDPAYCDVILRRGEAFSGITPTREDGTPVSFA